MSAPMTKPVLNVLELERVSTNKQDLERQEFDLADNREEYNLNPLQLFKIKESGEKVLKSEDIRLLVEALKRPGVDGLSVSAIDRIARPQDFVSIAFFQVFAELKKVIVSKREGVIEPWTPRGRKALMAALTQAGNELSDLKDRIKSNRRKMHKQERMCNTSPPFGMVYVDKYSKDAEGKAQYFKEDPVESSVPGLTKRQVVVDVFNWRWLNKLGPSAIQRRLNQAGILTTGRPGRFEPGPFSRSTVIQMLKNRHYIGEHWEGPVQVNCPCPQFIDREVFAGVQKMFKEGKVTSNGRNATKHLLVGYLRCKACKRRCRTVTGSARQVDGVRPKAYICGNYDYKIGTQVCRVNGRILCERIDAVVWGAIWRILTDPEILYRNAKAYYDSLPTPKGLQKLEKELATVRERMERTKRMVRNGTEDEATGTALIQGDQHRIREIEAELKAAGSVMMLPVLKIIEAGCRQIAEGPEPGDFQTRRPILEKLVDLKVWYSNGLAEIEGKVPVAIVAPKCTGRQRSQHTSVQYLPFKLEERVA
jgi:hypothetical protein